MRSLITMANKIHVRPLQTKIGITDGNEYQNDVSKKFAFWQELTRSSLSISCIVCFSVTVHRARNMLEGDTSIMTYRGHSVLQTLIRCHFSPSSITGQRYIYTGCAAGRVISKFLVSSIFKQFREIYECTINF